MFVSEVSNLKSLVGQTVRSTMTFAGIPAGTMGTVDEVYSIGKEHQGIMILWDIPQNQNLGKYGKPLRDGFGRDSKFDETCWLELID